MPREPAGRGSTEVLPAHPATCEPAEATHPDAAGRGPTETAPPDTAGRALAAAAPADLANPWPPAPTPGPAGRAPAAAPALDTVVGRGPSEAVHPDPATCTPAAALGAAGGGPTAAAPPDLAGEAMAAAGTGMRRHAVSGDVATDAGAIVPAAAAAAADQDAGACRPASAGPAFAPLRVAFPLGPVLDQCCGGHMTLVFAPLAHADLGRLQAAAAAVAGGRGRRRRFALWRDGPVYTEPPQLRPVFVYGGGHVGTALVAALAPLPFSVRWIDARAGGFLAPPPAGVDTRLTPLPETEAQAAPADAFHVVLTHSHALDLEIVAAVLERDSFGFLGLIGSATKKALFARRLSERGIPAGRLDRLICPIGLPGLRDKRPAVIAASTAAQLLHADAAARAQREPGTNPGG